MHDCDVMVAVGARFDDRVTGRLDAFSPGSKKIHIDIDPSSIGKVVRADMPIIGDAGQAHGSDVEAWPRGANGCGPPEWWEQIDEWRARDWLRYDQSRQGRNQAAIRNRAPLALTRGRNVYVTTEVGQHQMWAAQSSDSTNPIIG